MSHPSSCNCAITNQTAYSQTLSELDFARSIHQAVIDGKVSRVRQLLVKSANKTVNQPDEYGYKPLIYACGIKGENLEMVKVLVDAGACVNATTRHTMQTPLMRACCGTVPAIAEFLIEKGAITTSRNADGKTAADLVTSNNYWTATEKQHILSLLL